MFDRDLFGSRIKSRQSSTLPALFRSRKGELIARLDPKFEAFYRAELRGVRRYRVRSTALHARLVTWADANDVASLGFRGVRREMELIGHRRFLSDGVWYDDVAFAEDVPEIGDTLPAVPAQARLDPPKGVHTVHPLAEPHGVLGRIDAALAELLAIRREVEAMQAAAAPPLPAAAIVGAGH